MDYASESDMRYHFPLNNFQDKLKSSAIDELGCGCLRVGGAGQCSRRKKVSVATLQVAAARHRHTELLNRNILTDQNLHVPKPDMY